MKEYKLTAEERKAVEGFIASAAAARRLAESLEGKRDGAIEMVGRVHGMVEANLTYADGVLRVVEEVK